MKQHHRIKINNSVKKLYRKDIRSILEADITTDEDLYLLANQLGINDLLVNWLNGFDSKYKGPQILNLGSSSLDKTGTHWVAAYGNDYFDSFGMYPPKGLEHLNWTPIQLQDIDEGRCGQWCLLFIYYKKIGELDKFYSAFRSLVRKI